MCLKVLALRSSIPSMQHGGAIVLLIKNVPQSITVNTLVCVDKPCQLEASVSPPFCLRQAGQSCRGQVDVKSTFFKLVAFVVYP